MVILAHHAFRQGVGGTGETGNKPDAAPSSQASKRKAVLAGGTIGSPISLPCIVQLLDIICVIDKVPVRMRLVEGSRWIGDVGHFSVDYGGQVSYLVGGWCRQEFCLVAWME